MSFERLKTCVLSGIVDEVFEEMEVYDIIKEMGELSDDHKRSLMTVTVSDCSEELTKINK